MFEMVGAFPAIPARRPSGIKDSERELIGGGDYDVVGDETDERRVTTARFRYRGPAR